MARGKNLGAFANEMLLRLNEVAREQNQRARTLREQIQALRQRNAAAQQIREVRKALPRRNAPGGPK